jgi:hypothetical protein
MSDNQLTATRPPSRRAWILAACLVAAVVLVGCFPLLTGKAVPLWDAGEYFGPLFSLISDHAKAGHLMLWDPWISGGSPDFAEPQLGSASPVLLAFALLSPNPFHGFIAYWLAVWIFGGVGMMLLSKHLGAPVWGALVIALGFAACGVYTGNAEHTSWIYSFSFLPWIVWRFDKGLLERRYWFVIQAAVLWGLAAQGGYPGVTITDPIFLALWAAGRLWVGRNAYHANEPGAGAPRIRDFRMTGSANKRGAVYFVFSLLLLGLVGIAVMSPGYASFLRENRGYTVRASSLDRQFSLSSGVLPPAAYTTLASPYLYLLRRPDHRTIWPETDISMTNAYMGVLVTVLALAALARPSRWRLWLAGLAIFFGCCAVGNHLPVRGWLYDLVPATRYFRMPSLFRMYVVLVAGAIASYAVRDLDEDWQMQRTRSGLMVFAVSLVAGVAAVLGYAATLHSVQRTMADAGYPLLHLLFTWSVAALLFLLAWRGVLTRNVLAICFVALAVFDAGSTLRICNPTVYSVDAAPQWKAMEAQHVASLNLVPRGWDRTFLPPPSVGTSINDRNVALKIAGLSNRTPLKNTFFQQYLTDQTLSRIAVGPQRIWFSDHPVWLATTDANFAEFSQASHALKTPPMVLHSPDEMTGATTSSPSDNAWARSVQPMVPATANLVAYLPNALTFRYHADRDGWLLVTDRWAPAWTAKVNGRAQPVLVGNFIFRAVPVISGDNLIDFRYQPQGYWPSVALSWLVLALVLVGQAWLWWLRASRA